MLLFFLGKPAFVPAHNLLMYIKNWAGKEDFS